MIAFGGGTAWACDGPQVALGPAMAGPGDEVSFELSCTEPGDAFRVSVEGQEVASGTDEGDPGVAGSFTMPVALAALVAIVFYAVALQEQAFLTETFGSEYRAYAERVPLFFPRFSTWQEADQLVVRPELVRRTFMDASLFLLAVPFNDLIKWLQDHDWLRVLAHLP